MLNGLFNTSSLSQQATSSESLTDYFSKKPYNLIKPNFSSLILKENQFIPKTKGVLKKKKKKEMETPMKKPDINFFKPVKIIGRDLFGAKQSKILSLINYIF